MSSWFAIEYTVDGPLDTNVLNSFAVVISDADISILMDISDTCGYKNVFLELLS